MHSDMFRLMEDTGKLINRVVASFTLTGVILSVDATMTLVILAMSAIVIGLTFFSNGIKKEYYYTLNPMERKVSYIKRAFMLPDYAKELRISHVSENLFGEHDKNVKQQKSVICHYGAKLTVLNFIHNAVNLMGEFAESMAENVREALRKSTFSESLHKLANSLDTQLTREFDDEGTQISGGEQQKVAIARAFFKNADMIILDEPSSALDPAAEYELNKAITSYADSRTVIFISHRLSTTRHADRIYMFDGGKIIESGTHDELMAVNGKYAYMFRLQAEKYQ